MPRTTQASAYADTVAERIRATEELEELATDLEELVSLRARARELRADIRRGEAGERPFTDELEELHELAEEIAEALEELPELSAEARELLAELEGDHGDELAGESPVSLYVDSGLELVIRETRRAGEAERETDSVELLVTFGGPNATVTATAGSEIVRVDVVWGVSRATRRVHAPALASYLVELAETS